MQIRSKGIGDKSQQHGVAAIVVIVVIALILIPFGAFFVDIARVYVVRNQVQNAADAAAQVGAAALWPPNPSSPNVPYWQNGVNTAGAQLLANLAGNSARGVLIKTADIAAGYFKNTTPTRFFEVYPTLDPSIPAGAATNVDYIPAVTVSIPLDSATSKGNTNGGPVQMMFAGLMQLAGSSDTPTPIKAMATAVSGAGGAGPGALGGYAVSSCVFNAYWDTVANAPARDTDGKRYGFQLGAQIQCTPTASCLCGNIANWLKLAQPSPEVTIGGTLPLAGGDTTSDYGQANFPDQSDVVFPVIDETSCGTGPNPLNTCNAKVVGFACLHIDHTGGPPTNGPCIPSQVGSPDGLLLHAPTDVKMTTALVTDNNFKNKCFIVYFNEATHPSCTIPGGGAGGGTYYGAASTPQIVE